MPEGALSGVPGHTRKRAQSYPWSGTVDTTVNLWALPVLQLLLRKTRDDTSPHSYSHKAAGWQNSCC